MPDNNKHSLKRIVLALGAAIALSTGAAQAAPSLQSCAPMEVTHTGGIGMSYSMSCTAGGWHLRYAGAVPAGSEVVNVQYQLQVRGADGASFNQLRHLTLPSPAHLGQMLAREAVLLDDGDIALRECKEPHCTLYRPLGHQQGLSKATVTVAPEVQKLRQEREQLAAQLAEKTSLATQQAQQLDQLTADLARAQQAALDAEAKLTEHTALNPSAAQATESKDETLKALSINFESVMSERNQLKLALADKQSEMDAAQAQMANAIAEQARLAAALADAQARQATAQSDMESAQQQLRILEANNQALEAELLAANATMERHRAQLDQISGSDSAKAVATLTDQLLNVERKLAEAQRAASEKDSELSSLKGQVSQLEAERTALAGDQEAYWKNTISTLLDDRHVARQQARQAEEALAASTAREAKLQAELRALQDRQTAH